MSLSTSSSNSFLRSQRKSDLLELAEAVGFKKTDGLKKTELEVALDNYLSEHHDFYSTHPIAQPYYNARARQTGSPVKPKDLGTAEPRKRRGAAKAAEQAISEAADDDSELTSSILPASATPGNRVSSLARRIPLPASPADVVRAVDQRTLALRERIYSTLDASGFKEVTFHTRDTLSTVPSLLFAISAFELYHLRQEILADRYAFTIPAIHALGTSDYPIQLPDLFLLFSGSFWSPFTLWLMTSVIVPAIFAFYFNFAAVNTSATSRRPKTWASMFDPLSFSIAKAVITYVVYQQGANFNGWVSQDSVARINSAIYGGWKGVLTGAFISGVASVYEAVLRKK